MIRSMSIVNGIIIIFMLIGGASAVVRGFASNSMAAALLASMVLCLIPFVLARRGLASTSTAGRIKAGRIANMIAASLIGLLFIVSIFRPGMSFPLASSLAILICVLNIIALSKGQAKLAQAQIQGDQEVIDWKSEAYAILTKNWLAISFLAFLVGVIVYGKLFR